MKACLFLAETYSNEQVKISGVPGKEDEQRMITDYHVHTEFSDDSFYDMEEAVKQAIKIGLTEICFTDHVDYGIKRDWNDSEGIVYRKGGPGEPERMAVANVDYPRYFEKIAYLKEKYKGQISIKQGMEFGMQTHTIPEYRKLFNAYEFDFIIMSCHQVEDKEFWTQDFQQGKTQEEYNRRYYGEILKVIREYKDYSVIGHLDLIVRYDKAGKIPFEKVKDLITAILLQVIADGKGIEINTSSYRYGLDDLTPSGKILECYRDLGGRIITFGSDSHKEEHLGAHIREAMKELGKMGFTEYYTFDRMRPIAHSL